MLLRAIIRYLRSVYGLDIGITAPTGIAGLNIGGQTIHSWAGIGLGKEPLEKLKFRLNSDAIERWSEAKALIIDEGWLILCGVVKWYSFVTVSMLDGRLLDKLVGVRTLLENSINSPHARYRKPSHATCEGTPARLEASR